MRRGFGLSTVLLRGQHGAAVEGYGGSIEASPGVPSAQPSGLSAALPLGPEAGTRPGPKRQRFPRAAPRESAVCTPRKPFVP